MSAALETALLTVSRTWPAEVGRGHIPYSMSVTRHLLEQTFRVNPDYELVSFSRLKSAERAAVADLARNRGFVGILRPCRPITLGTKSASRQLAELLRSLRTAGRLPSRMRRRGVAAHEVARLVLDGILQVERDGRFVCGASADHLLDYKSATKKNGDRITSLSLAALAYGEALPISDPSRLSARMYFFNRRPVTLRWLRQLPTPKETLEFLGVQGGARVAAKLDRHWKLVDSAETRGWLSWWPKRRRRKTRDFDATHKLYVSPACEFTRDAFCALVDALVVTEPVQFKVGRDAHGLLRPDKLVVYFESRRQLDEVAANLARDLRGLPPHGVPFTASITTDGLLSRGVDPPRAFKVLSWHETESWRLWITNRLAVYILTARATASDQPRVSPAAFAMGRLELDGLDVETWSLTSAAWSAGARSVS